MRFFYVYILRSIKNGSYYIGYTRDLVKRIAQHNSGLSQATKPFKPYELIAYEAFLDEKDAKCREIYLKSGWGRRSLMRMLKHYLLTHTLSTDIINSAS